MLGPERVHLGVGDLEPGVSDAGTCGEPTRFGDWETNGIASDF